MADFSGLSSQISRSFYDAEQAGDASSYQKAAALFSESEKALREYIQEKTKGEIFKVIQKLQKGTQLNRDEVDGLKLWIVGDADYYTKMENNFNDWVSELKRIVGEIGKIEASQPSVEAASRLRALLEDGTRVIYDITFFLEKKERVVRFEESTKALESEERDLLVKILSSKLVNKEF